MSLPAFSTDQCEAVREAIDYFTSHIASIIEMDTLPEQSRMYYQSRLNQLQEPYKFFNAMRHPDGTIIQVVPK